MNKSIIKALAKRVLSSVIIIFLLVSFVFILLRLAPGDVSQKLVSPELSPELAEKVRESFHLNDSVFDQYTAFIVNLMHGDLGISYNHNRPVTEVIMEYLPFTVFLAVSAIIIQLVFGFLLAILSVRKIYGPADRFLSKLTLVMFSAPPFVVGVFLIYIFAGALGIFPSSGLSSFDNYAMPFPERIADYLNHLILPFITVSFGGTAIYYKYLRDNLEEIYNKPFILNLRAHGFKEKTILLKHIIPNAINPLISVVGVELGILLSGALITEVIFGLPGMGRLTINAIITRDYPLVIGCTFAAGVFMIFSNLAADLVKAGIDKRIFKEIIN